MRRLTSSRLRVSIVAIIVCSLIATSFLVSGGGGRAQDIDISQLPASPSAAGPAIPPEVADYANDWPVGQGDLAATRNAAGSTIDSTNVGELEVAWQLPIETTSSSGGMTAPPIVVGDTLYVQDMSSNVLAVDRNTGAVKWETRYDIPTAGPNGVAIGYGLIYGTIGDTAEVFALNAETGVEVWRVTLSNNAGEGIDMQPTVYDNTVYVSTVPGNTTQFYRGGRKGILYALDAANGQTLWQFDTTVDNLWNNPRYNSGGGLWYPASVDDEGNLYFGVGNAGPWPGNEEFPNGSSRPGDNDYASSMVSLDRNGSLRWYVNAKPHDLFDLDFQLTPIITTIDISGTPTKVAIGAGKTGTVIAANADTGEVLWKVPVGTHQNDELQELPTADPVEVFPGPLGGVETSLAYADDTIFVPVVNLPLRYTATGFDLTEFDYAQGSGELVALNAADGSVKWKVDLAGMNLGAATVSNDVVFSGGLDGVFHAYNVADGTELWSYQAQAGINAPPAIAGDMLFLPAAGFLVAPSSTADATPAAAPAEGETTNYLIAFKIGGADTTAATAVAPSETPTTAATETPAASPTTEEPSASPVAGDVVEVSIAQLKFDPVDITIPVGTTIRWTNEDTVEHTVTDKASTPLFDSGLFGQGETFEFTFTEPGTFEYYCIPHPFMIGTITVE